MLRSVLLGMLALTAVGACGKSAPPAAQPGAIAGNVVEVTGEVSIVRAGETRALPLAKGATVAADDEIVTGADGRVAIVLSHNNARWDVKPGTRKKVSDSAAWGLAKVDQPAEVVEHATSAAGRDQERAGAETSVTAAVAAKPPTAPSTRDDGDRADKKTEPSVAPKSDGAMDQRAKGGASPETMAAPGASLPPPPVTETPPAPPPPPPPPPPKPASLKPGPAKTAPRPVGDQDVGLDDAKPLVGGGGGGPAAVDLHVPELTACLAPGTKRLLTITVARGAITFALAGGEVTPATKACVGKIVTSLKLTADGSTKLVLDRP